MATEIFTIIGLGVVTVLCIIIILILTGVITVKATIENIDKTDKRNGT